MNAKDVFLAFVPAVAVRGALDLLGVERDVKDIATLVGLAFGVEYLEVKVRWEVLENAGEGE